MVTHSEILWYNISWKQANRSLSSAVMSQPGKTGRLSNSASGMGSMISGSTGPTSAMLSKFSQGSGRSEPLSIILMGLNDRWDWWAQCACQWAWVSPLASRLHRSPWNVNGFVLNGSWIVKGKFLRFEFCSQCPIGSGHSSCQSKGKKESSRLFWKTGFLSHGYLFLLSKNKSRSKNLTL